MVQATAPLASIATFQQPLEGAIRRWTQQIRSGAWKDAKERAHRRPVLDLAALTRSVLDVQSCADNWPLTRFSIDDDGLRAKCEQESILVAVETTLTGDKLWLTLSDLALESARGTLLLTPHDAFPVTIQSGLVATALANLLWMLDRLRSHPKERLPVSAARFVLEPLAMREQFAIRWAPGDLWIALLAARTANRAWQAFAANATAPAVGNKKATSLSPLVLCQQAVPAFTRHSALGKLIDAPHLASFVAQRAAYDQLPGLDVLTADPHAGIARRLLTSELAFNLSMKPAGNASRGALLRWLQGLNGLRTELGQSVALVVAHFLWELLELDDEAWAQPEPELEAETEEPPPAAAESLLLRLSKDKTVGRALREAITAFEQMADSALSADDELSRRLVDVRSMLRCYEPYCKLCLSLPRVALPAQQAEPKEPVSSGELKLT